MHYLVKINIYLIAFILLNGCSNDTELNPASIVNKNDKTFTIIQDKLSDNNLAPELVIVPSGSNTLGDTTGAGINNESPTYKVTINKPFAIGKYEVTFEEYDLFCEETKTKKPEDEGWGRENLPVINISWDDAHSYVKWLSQQTGKKYFLPSEAQWEYAARAGTQTNYWWGNKPGDKLAQCADCAAINRCEDCKDVPLLDEGTAPVGSYTANPFGLYDVHGNVMEWVADCGFKTHSSKPSDGTTRRGGDCNKHIMKNGSWWNNVNFIRASVRGSAFDDPDYKSFHVGFRVAREVN